MYNYFIPIIILMRVLQKSFSTEFGRKRFLGHPRLFFLPSLSDVSIFFWIEYIN